MKALSNNIAPTLLDESLMIVSAGDFSHKLWLLDRPDELFRGFLLELMEARYGTASTVFCTQFRQKDWHARLGGGVHADAIMGSIVHGAAWVGMGEMNMRRKLGSDSSWDLIAGTGRGADPCRSRRRFTI